MTADKKNAASEMDFKKAQKMIHERLSARPARCVAPTTFFEFALYLFRCECLCVKHDARPVYGI